MVNKNDIALVTEILLSDVAQSVQDTMKLLKPDDVENPPGFVTNNKTLAIDEPYYKRIMLRALGEYEEDLYDGQVSPIKGVDCQTLINDVKEFRDKLISSKMVLVEDTDMQPGDDIGYDEQDGIVGNLGSVQKKEETVAVEKTKDFASETRAQSLEKETKLIKGLLHSYELLYSNNLSEKHSNEVRELSKKLFNGNIILVENNDTEWEKYQDSLSCGEKASALASETVRKSPYSAFLKRLRRLKSSRKRKSIVKVITETTIEEFEAQLTKHANNGYKIKYVNINTKAGNSGTGVRYYAVAERSF
ncbi:MAG: hypothetical protein NUV76_02490 [Candidatus Kuenenia sp.]|nr:hypothetical protein [Candidatus Kuenenia sp.]